MRIKDFLNRPVFQIAGLQYAVAWCSVIKDRLDLGYCDDIARVIYMKDERDIDETFKTLLHEIIHAMDYTYSLKLKHNQVRKLELALADFLIQNDLVK